MASRFFLTKINDFTHRIVKTNPVVKSISFDMAAQGLLKAPSSEENPRKKSAHPMNANSPIRTAMCMSIFLVFGRSEEVIPRMTIGRPIMLGISDVMLPLPLMVLTATPQIMRNAP